MDAAREDAIAGGAPMRLICAANKAAEAAEEMEALARDLATIDLAARRDLQGLFLTVTGARLALANVCRFVPASLFDTDSLGLGYAEVVLRCARAGRMGGGGA